MGATPVYRRLRRMSSGKKQWLIQQTLPSRPDGSEHDILVVEDEAPLRLLISALLGQLNVSLTVLVSADEALEQYRQGLKPSLLITDILMPGTSGLELARQTLDIIDDVRILMISADPNRPGLRELAQSPRVAFLEKPFSTTELLNELAVLLAV